MTQRISGPGQSLPTPANLFPSYLTGTPYDAPMNYVGLAAGDAIYIPADSNDYMVQVGAYSVLQWLDPVTGVWRSVDANRGQPMHISSNGSQNFRIANLTGCPVAAIIAGGGTGFAQATATITANVGGSTWQAIVGGSLSVSTISVAGANYTVPPLVMIPVPPNPGVQATAHAILASGTVSSIVLDNVGAGYISAPTAVLEPHPFDVNAGTITQATVVFALVNAGKITAALCTNNGASLATLSALTLTAAGGAGSGATITPQILQTVTLASVVAGGAAWGTATAFAAVTAAGGGGNTSVSAIGNPAIEMTGFRPRQAIITGTCNAGGTITAATILDGGLFLSAPAVGAAIASGGTIPTTLASVALTTGGIYDTVLVQPL